jgi:hypothetical protein
MTDLICKYCLKRGHSKETCWTLDPNQKRARFGGGPPRRGCTQCGRIHYMERCTVTTDEELASLHREVEKEAEAQHEQLASLYRKVDVQQKKLLLIEEQYRRSKTRRPDPGGSDNPRHR